MKIIHVADIHLDSKMNTHLNTNDAKVRKAEILETFRRVIVYALDHEIYKILIAGDLFDTNKVNKGTKDVVEALIRNNGNIDFYYLRGNHDASSFLNSLEELPENLHLFANTWTSYALSEQVCLTGVEFNGHNAQSIYNELVLDQAKINIVTMHGQEAVSVGKDKTEIVSLNELKNKGIDYLALGHIHSYKYETLDARGMYCYPGCLEGRGFDECGDHGFCVVDINEETHQVSSTFVPFASRHLYVIAADVSGLENMEDMLQVCKQSLDESSCNGNDLVRLELVGAIDEHSEINEEIIKAPFVDSYFYFEVRNSTTIKVDYDKYMYDESLKGEFIRLIKNDDSLSEEEKGQIIRYGIEALSSGEINL